MQNWMKLTGVAGALLLAGCSAVGPDYRAPALPEVNLAMTGEMQTSAYERQWWQRFEDPVLEQLVTLTLDNNQSLAAAQANIDRVMAQFIDIDNDSLPSGTVDLNYQNSKGQQPGITTDRVQSRRYQGGANVAWQLDLAGRLKRASESALASAGAAEAELHSLQVALISNLVSRYADHLSLQQRIRVAERNGEILGKTAEIVGVRLDEGLASAFELARVEARQSAVRASISELNSQLHQAAYDIALLAGQQPGTLPVALASGELPQLSAPVAIGDAGELLKRRPDVRAAERRLAAATADIGVATADLYPDVSVSGFLGFLTGSAGGIDSNAGAWTLAPSIRWQGLDWGSVEARIAAADAGQRQAMADYRQQLLVALNEAQSSLSRYGFSRQRLQHLADQQQAMNEAMTLADAQYQSGLSDLLDLLDTEQRLLEARDDYAVGQAAVMKDLVAIYHAFGGAMGTPGNTPLALAAR